ncbi:MAG: pyruvate kinase alpha/beta domain-containing protein, partial [Planctomycetota bacterium]
EAEIAKTPNKPAPPTRLRQQRRMIPALAHGAWHIAQDTGAKLIVLWSQLGGEARYLSRNSFRVPIIAFTSDERAVRRMNLLSGVFPVLVRDVPAHRSDFAAMADRMLINMGWANQGDPVIMLAGKPINAPGATNTMAVRYAGELLELQNLQLVDHDREGWAT